MLLVNIKPGTRYQIDSIDCSDETTIRLMILGLVEGTEIELISFCYWRRPHGIQCLW